MASSVAALFTNPGGVGFVYRNKSYLSASVALQAYISEFDGQEKYKQFQTKYNYTPTPKNGNYQTDPSGPSPQRNGYWNLSTPVRVPSTDSVSDFDCVSCTPDMTRFEGIDKVEGIPKWVAEMDPPLSRKYLRGRDPVVGGLGGSDGPQGAPWDFDNRRRVTEPAFRLRTPDLSVRSKVAVGPPGGSSFRREVPPEVVGDHRGHVVPDSVAELRRERLERSSNARRTKSHVSLDDASDVTYTPSAIANLFPDDERALEISMRVEEYRQTPPGRRNGGGGGGRVRSATDPRLRPDTKIRSRSLSSSSRTPRDRPRTTAPGPQRSSRAPPAKLLDDEILEKFDRFAEFDIRGTRPPGKRTSDSTLRTSDTEFLVRQPPLPPIVPSDVLSSPTKSMEFLFPTRRSSSPQSSPDTEEVLDADRPWERKITTTDLTDIKTGLSFIDSPKQSVMDMFLEGYGNADAATGGTKSHNVRTGMDAESCHQSRPVESLKNMLFQMQTVASATEEIVQSAITSTQDIVKKKGDFDLSTSTQELLNVIENKDGTESLEKAMHHLNKLQGLMSKPGSN